MDLNQLYFDHQISLMRAAQAGDVTDRAAHRAHASTIARTITDIHRASGADAINRWEARYTSADQPLSRPFALAQ